jgi:6-phosphogluconolactonase
MKASVRPSKFFISGVLLSAVLAAMAGCRQPEARGIPLYIGTYTRGWACEVGNGGKGECGSSGIYRSTFNPETGTLSEARLVAETENPSYLAISRNGEFLYAVNEVGDFKGQKTGGVSAFRIKASGELQLINQLDSHGADPCHLSINAAGDMLFVANYSSGSIASYTIAGDGSIADADQVQHTGSGPDKNQQVPHAHFVAESPRSGKVYAADLGADRVFVYDVSSDARLSEARTATGKTPAGAGPRHLAFSADGRFVYANAELSSHVIVLAVDGSGALKEIQYLSTLPEGYKEDNSTAEIQLSHDGRFAYVSNRGENSLAIFSVNPDDGRLAFIETTPAGVDWPRDFKIDNTGRYLLVEGQKSNNIAVQRIDTVTGKLTSTGIDLKINKPVNIAFMPR